MYIETCEYLSRRWEGFVMLQKGDGGAQQQMHCPVSRYACFMTNHIDIRTRYEVKCKVEVGVWSNKETGFRIDEDEIL